MEACLLITKTNKDKNRKGKILFINAVNEVRTEKAISYLDDVHIAKIYGAYRDFKDNDGFCKVVAAKEVLNNNASLNLAVYVSNVKRENVEEVNLKNRIKDWEINASELRFSINTLIEELQN
jgi:type I restriction enzyme M protein